MIINQASLSALFTGFKTAYQFAFDNSPSDFEKITMVVPSAARQEVYAWLGRTTKFREWLGDRVVQNLGLHDYTIKNRDWENTVGVDRNDIEDDSYGVYTPLFSQLGQDARMHPDELVFGLIKDGFTQPCFDGQYFFDVDHPVLDESGTPVSTANLQDGTGTPWFLLDTSKAIKPVIFQKRKEYTFVSMVLPTDEAVFSQKNYRYGVDARVNAGYGLWQLAYASKQPLTMDNYAAVRTAMLAIKGDNGRPLGIRPSVLLVPPSLEKAALDCVMAERLANGMTNTYRNTAEVLTTPWLA